MAKKKNPEDAKPRVDSSNVMGLRAEVLEQPITETLELNYMPYAMSVIVSRAIPEIDGLKPSHRKLLYTMYQMKLLGGARTKSANVVGQTMKLNPHGDAAIYDTMVRLSRGYGALLHPLVDSKGNFGKVYSRDMSWAASRYTEVRLDAICAEFFRDIDQDTVDFVDNYDGKMKEPTLLPTTFPNVLVSANQGIAVGMASNLCGFNLGEVCDTTIAYIKNPGHDIMTTLKAPDLPTGGELLYDEAALADIYRTGRGSFKVRSKWRYLKSENLIEVYEIPYSTTTEVIIDKVAELIKAGKVREIADIRDETDLSGLKLTIDLKRGTDPDKLMQKLFRLTPLMDSQSCNFNILIAGMPRVMGVREILEEWVAWRMESVRRRIYYSMTKKKEKLHLLKGLRRILLDIDRAIKIIRETEEDDQVVPNLMIGFGIDQVQAEYVADIRLRNINKEYILRRTQEVDALADEIADLEDTVNSPKRIQKIIISELEDVKKKYAQPRRTDILYDVEQETAAVEEDETPDYPVTVFFSREGYLKKITPQSLRMASDQKYKEGDGPFLQWEATNRDELLVFTDKQQCYKTRMSDFDDSKASVLGDYLPTKLGMESDERAIWACIPGDYSGSILFCFDNGKIARVEVAAYQTQTKRKKLTGAYSDKAPLVAAYLVKEDFEAALISTEGRCLIFHTASLNPKTTRTTQGVNVMTLKPKYRVEKMLPLTQTPIVNTARYRSRSLPVAGALLKEEDRGEEQMTLL
ncbi:topoisomerase IV [Pseudoflavonifractor sp. AF19-9AC]|uniref:DNA gyrase subunit A n=1 Tax=Pseudoflavonifractor sp. AF19-9AC TaxID=2292244 RepID=UPI000E506EF5|nr:DNA gyrase subunit A [Pseudoflavonifractor sp. AF19-9AC]RHR10959.1 topoisomerase IV [Pseudoflavonifractor sp. AF19-9AC]